MMKDGTYKVKLDKDGTPIFDEQVMMSSGYWVADESGVSVHGRLDRRGLLDALSLMDIEDGEVVGIWENEGISYIDRAYHIDEMIEAIEIAKQNSQLSIWDCEKAEAVYL
jgi:hypothetical protein